MPYAGKSDDFKLPASAFKGGYAWPRDLKKRMWRWNRLLQQLHRRLVLHPFPRTPANLRTGQQVGKLLECRGSWAVRLGYPLPMHPLTGGSGKAHRFPAICTLRASPIRAEAYAKQRLERSGKLASLKKRNPRRVMHITLGHRNVPCKGSDADAIWRQLDRMYARLDKFREVLGSLAAGGLIVHEADRSRDAGGSVWLHLHVLIEPKPMKPAARRFHIMRLRKAWAASAVSGDDRYFYRASNAKNFASVENRLYYLHGVHWRGRFKAKILDGTLLPKPVFKLSAVAKGQRVRWWKKGKLHADQLYLILATYSYPRQSARWFGSWHKLSAAPSRP